MPSPRSIPSPFRLPESSSLLADGPSWITRCLRLQPEKPPTIDDRVRYLKEHLALPEEERQLRDPQQDQQQRSYKM